MATKTTVALITRINAELTAARERIDGAGRATRTHELDAARRWSDEALQLCERSRQSVCAEFANVHERWFVTADPSSTPRVNYYHARIAAAATIGAIAFCILETLFTGATAFLFLIISGIKATVIGCVVALLIAFALKGIVVPLMIAPTEGTPLRTRDRIIRWLLITGSVETLLLFLLLVVARSYYSGNGVAPIGPIMAALSVWTPIVAGLLFALAGLFGWSSALSHDYAELERLEARIRELRDLCEREQMAGHGGRALAVVTVCALVILGGMSFTPAFAADASSSSAEVDCVVDVWDDATGSVVQSDRMHAKHTIVEGLGVSLTGCARTTWRFFRFGANAWIEAPAVTVTVSSRITPCAAPVLTEASRLFANAREAAVERARLECERTRERDRARLNSDLRKAMTIVEKAWASDASTTAEQCTSLADVLQRIASMSGRTRAIILSDGVDTCSGLRPIPARDDRPAAVLVLLATAKTESKSLAQDFLQRKQRLSTIVPWVKIVTPWEYTPQLLAPTPK